MRKISEKPLERATEHVNKHTRLTLTVNPLLCAQIKNRLKIQHSLGDFTYPNISAFIREALKALMEEKIKLNYQEQISPKNKLDVGVRLSPELYEFYKSLTEKKRSHIVNLAIKTYFEEEIMTTTNQPKKETSWKEKIKDYWIKKK